jgi:rRNA-processing protein FCF1
MLPRTLAQRALRLASRSTSTSTSLLLRPSSSLLRPQPTARFASHLHQPPLTGTTTTPGSNRHLSSGPGPSAADARIEEITELYATAQDEFEIAMEETEKQTVYAQDDRDAAREELEKVLEAYRAAVEGEDRELAEEVRRRIGHRVRELEMGVKRMEEMATEHD